MRLSAAIHDVLGTVYQSKCAGFCNWNIVARYRMSEIMVSAF